MSDDTRCQWRRYGQGEQCCRWQGHAGEHDFGDSDEGDAAVGNVVCTIEEWNALHAELAAARAKIAALEARG